MGLWAMLNWEEGKKHHCELVEKKFLAQNKVILWGKLYFLSEIKGKSILINVQTTISVTCSI